MKNHAYLALSPRVVGIAKIAMIRAAHPKNAHSIHGRARPMRVRVLSMRAPKKISDAPSKMRATIMRVPITPALRPAVSVR